MLLLKLVGELECRLRGNVRHLLLKGVKGVWRGQVLSWWDHPHIDILLMCSLYLLLLLLKQLDLLLYGKLFHCKIM
jgi:hypothetical protein